jgi:hypothetical protein
MLSHNSLGFGRVLFSTLALLSLVWDNATPRRFAIVLLIIVVVCFSAAIILFFRRR